MIVERSTIEKLRLLAYTNNMLHRHITAQKSSSTSWRVTIQQEAVVLVVVLTANVRSRKPAERRSHEGGRKTIAIAYFVQVTKNCARSRMKSRFINHSESTSTDPLTRNSYWLRLRRKPLLPGDIDRDFLNNYLRQNAAWSQLWRILQQNILFIWQFEQRRGLIS